MVGLGAILFGTSAVVLRTGSGSVDVGLFRILNEVPAGVAAVLTPLSHLFLPAGIIIVVVITVCYVVTRNRSVMPVAAAARRVAFRTESGVAARRLDVLRYLEQEMVPAAHRLGAAARAVDNPDARGGPFLIAHRREGPGLPSGSRTPTPPAPSTPPDEHLLALLAREALQLMAALFWDPGEYPGPVRVR